ncbi:M48 family metallopeptidase [Streptomyces chumphonensis]|uniref:M48 family metallopeptidase n=1 Tax=Streptomyces chumphonensis TaxID=1214925 RepID=UPI003D747778
MTAAWRGALALALVAGFYALSWVLVLGYGALALGVLWWTVDGPGPLTSPMPLFAVAFGLPGVLAVLRGLLAGGRVPEPEPGTVRLSRAQAPRLWGAVTELAERVGAPEPTEIRLTPDVSASVSEDTRFGLRVSARRLEIGLPLLAGLRADEVRAVLCHELGHYARRHTRFGATVYRGSVALHTARSGIVAAAVRNPLVAVYSGLQYRVLGAYGWLYDAVSLAVRRRQEFEADAAAAAVAGPAAMASALTAVPVLEAAWGDFRQRFLDPMAARGRVPDDPVRAFTAMLTDTEYGEALEEWRREQPERDRSRLDSHPPTQSRLRALRLRSGAAPGAVADPRPGRVLLEGGALEGGLSDAVRRALPTPAGRRAVVQPWEEWLDDAVEVQAIGAVEDLRGALALLGSAPLPTVDGVLGLLEAGRGEELAGALSATDWGTARWGAPGSSQRAVAVLVGQALVTAGRAAWSVRWASPGVLVPFDEEAREAHALAAAAVTDRAAAARLRFLLVVCGVNTGVALARTGEVSRLRVPRPARERGRRPAREVGRRVNVGGIVVALALLGVFGWSQLEPERDPVQPLPATSVDPFRPDRGTSPLPVPSGVRPYPPLPVPGVSRSPDCGVRELPVGGRCLPYEVVLPSSRLTPVVTPPFAP